MKFYDFNQIKAAADCAAVARELLALPLSPEGRCAAVWRGGSNPESVSINKDGWHDFGTEESGSVIDLVARVRNISTMAAHEILGDYLKLTPTCKAYEGGPLQPSARAEKLIAQGYREVKRYNYTDADGKLVNQVVRYEHPEKPKEFLSVPRTAGASATWCRRSTTCPRCAVPTGS